MLTKELVFLYKTTCLFLLALAFIPVITAINHDQKEAYRQVDVLLSIQSVDDLSFDRRNIYIYLNRCYNQLKDTFLDIENDTLDSGDDENTEDGKIESETVKLIKSLIDLYDLIIQEKFDKEVLEKEQVEIKFNTLIREISLKVTEFENDLGEQVAHIGKYLATLIVVNEDSDAASRMVAYKDKRNKAKAKKKTVGSSFWTILLRKIFEK